MNQEHHVGYARVIVLCFHASRPWEPRRNAKRVEVLLKQLEIEGCPKVRLCGANRTSQQRQTQKYMTSQGFIQFGQWCASILKEGIFSASIVPSLMTQNLSLHNDQVKEPMFNFVGALMHRKDELMSQPLSLRDRSQHIISFSLQFVSPNSCVVLLFIGLYRIREQKFFLNFHPKSFSPL